MVRFISAIASKMNFVSGLAILLMVAVMTIDVISRYFFNTSLFDSIEISSLLLGTINCMALAFVTEQEEHITFDLVIERLSIRNRGIAKAFTLTVSIVIFALLTWQATIRGISSFKDGEYYGTMEIPLWPVKCLFALACFLSLLVFATQLIACFTRKGIMPEEKTSETI